jgi:hypothetical protein
MGVVEDDEGMLSLLWMRFVKNPDSLLDERGLKRVSKATRMDAEETEDTYFDCRAVSLSSFLD